MHIILWISFILRDKRRIIFEIRMEYGICIFSVIALRAEVSEKSEMLSQVLFGESYLILLKKGKWLKVKLHFDQYEGWISENQHFAVSEKYFQKYSKLKHPIALELIQTAVYAQHKILITAGSYLPEYDGMQFKFNDTFYQCLGQAVFPEQLPVFEKVIEKIALKFLGVPYLWGGRTPLGIDCSGFTQIVFKILGIALKRDAYQQATQGNMIDFIELAKPGDLAFFENEYNKISHVGILLSDQKIIHASGSVRIDTIDHYGIYQSENNRYSHRLKLIKRYA